MKRRHQTKIDNLRGRISIVNQGLAGARACRDAELNERKMGREYNFSSDRLAKAEADVFIRERSRLRVCARRSQHAEASKNSGKDA